jgi:hypothetical protein
MTHRNGQSSPTRITHHSLENMMSRIRSVVSFVTTMVVAAACGDRTTTPTGVSATPSAGVSANLEKSGHLNFALSGTVSGFPTGIVFLSGGGNYDPSTASNVIPTDTRVNAGGGFSCIRGVGQGPLTNCATGEGVRWDTEQLLASTSFKCRLSDTAVPISTGPETAVLFADFYRAGDGNDESFRAQMIVTSKDLDPVTDGIQNLWIQGVGCGSAVVHFGE